MWALGRHRLLCSDNREHDAVDRLLAGAMPDLLLTDPPYCSGAREGGWREAQRTGNGGSKGSNAPYVPVFGDTLSTRGYVNLMRSALQPIPQTHLGFIFLDWRMWVEAANWNIRGMLVWDKITAGLGKGFRSQHELVMMVARRPPAFDWRKGKPIQGNVLRCKRSGNKHHPLEKPVPLLETILDVAGHTSTVFDPFVGAGSTFLAAERTGQTVYGVEIERAHCETAVARWEALTGERARLVE